MDIKDIYNLSLQDILRKIQKNRNHISIDMYWGNFIIKEFDDILCELDLNKQIKNQDLKVLESIYELIK